MEQIDVIQAAWVLCNTLGRSAEQEAVALASQFAALGAEPAAQLWRELARHVRTIQRSDDSVVLQ